METIKEKYFTSRGRIRRTVYFARELMVFTLLGGIAALMQPYLKGAHDDPLTILSTLLVFLSGAAALCAHMSLLTRRLHDLGWSGWLGVLTAIPIGNVALVLLAMLLRGDRGYNKYGQDPR